LKINLRRFYDASKKAKLKAENISLELYKAEKRKQMANKANPQPSPMPTSCAPPQTPHHTGRLL